MAGLCAHPHHLPVRTPDQELSEPNWESYATSCEVWSRFCPTWSPPSCYVQWSCLESTVSKACAISLSLGTAFSSSLHSVYERGTSSVLERPLPTFPSVFLAPPHSQQKVMQHWETGTHRTFQTSPRSSEVKSGYLNFLAYTKSFQLCWTTSPWNKKGIQSQKMS